MASLADIAKNIETNFIDDIVFYRKDFSHDKAYV
jgi:hypothetical protein